ncbi:hypothetical protein QEN19_000405 [Hanseniaspora menglaensis]
MSTSCTFTFTHDPKEIYDISGKALKLTTSEDIKEIIENLSKYEKVTKIDISGNTISDEPSKDLADFIKNTPAIFENLVECNFADIYTSRLVDEVVKSLDLFSEAFLKCEKLTYINLSDNAFGLRTIDILEKFIAEKVSLKHLILSNNGMGPFAGERIGKALTYLSQAQTKKYGKTILETFICGRNRLENGSAKYISLGLYSFAESLKTVRLYQNGIRPEGIHFLIEGLLNCNVLECIDLQDNTFTSKPGTKFAEGMPKWANSLVELNLNDCLIKNEGSRAILTQFLSVEFKKLETLKLQYNEILQETLESVIIPIFESNHLPSLKLLEISGNIFEEESEAIEALQELYTGELDELDEFEELDSEEEDSEEEEEELSEKVDFEDLIEGLSGLKLQQ